MVSYMKKESISAQKSYIELVALSTDTLPLIGIANGSMAYIMDTKVYKIFDEETQTWLDV